MVPDNIVLNTINTNARIIFWAEVFRRKYNSKVLIYYSKVGIKKKYNTKLY